jgi:hypothetical protein
MNLPGVVKSALTPGSIPCFVLCLLLWLFLKYAWPRRRRLAWAWLAATMLVYFLLALPLVANAIVARLPAVPQADITPGLPSARSSSWTATTVLAVSSRHCACIGRRRCERSSCWARTGIRGELDRAGIPPDRLTRVLGPATTGGQMSWIAEHAQPRPDGPTVVIASRLQLPRVAALARARGLTALLIGSPIDDEPPTQGAMRVIPSYIALRASRDALYEHAALAYYRWHGWIDR